MYQRLREEEMRRAAKVFFEKQIERNIFPEMLELVDGASRQRSGDLGGQLDQQLGDRRGRGRFGIPADGCWRPR